MQNIKVYVSVPTLGAIPTDTVASLIEYSKLAKHEHAIGFEKNTYIHYARNKAVWNAVDYGATHLMFIDSDMVFPGGGVDHLLSLEKDIVGGLYFGRREEFPAPIALKIEDNATKKYLQFPEDEPTFEVDAIGTGFMLINMDVFKKVDPPYFYHSTPDEWGLNEVPFPNNEIGEDVAFCLNMGEQGYKIYANQQLELGHVGEKTFRDHDYQRWIREEYENFKKQQQERTGIIQ